MEGLEIVQTCREHGKPIQSICVTCWMLICFKCQATHFKKGCKSAIDLPTYAAEEVLPKYKTLLHSLEERRGQLEGTLQTLLLLLPEIRQKLQLLKDQTEKLLADIQHSLEAIDLALRSHSAGITTALYRHDCCLHSLMQQQQELQSAIEKDNIECIIPKLKLPCFPVESAFGSGEKQQLQTAETTVARLLESKDFQKLHDDLQGLLAICEKTFRPDWNALGAMSDFVYGVCKPLDCYKKLCKYDILTKKLLPCITVPYGSSVLQVSKRIFVSGGYNPLVNVLAEYIETTQSLVGKSAMKYPKYCHSLVAVSTSAFYSIGGCSGTSAIPHCEEYCIPDNKTIEVWGSTVKRLSKTCNARVNRARCYAAAVLFDLTSLYVLGGSCSDSTIELLSLVDKSQWTLVNILKRDITFQDTTAGFVVSSDEIMVIDGINGSNTALYNVKQQTIKKHSYTPRTDYFCFNAVCRNQGLVYILGADKGDLLIYKTAEAQFEEIEHSMLYP